MVYNKLHQQILANKCAEDIDKNMKTVAEFTKINEFILNFYTIIEINV